MPNHTSQNMKTTINESGDQPCSGIDVTLAENRLQSAVFRKMSDAADTRTLRIQKIVRQVNEDATGCLNSEVLLTLLQNED